MGQLTGTILNPRFVNPNDLAHISLWHLFAHVLSFAFMIEGAVKIKNAVVIPACLQTGLYSRMALN